MFQVDLKKAQEISPEDKGGKLVLKIWHLKYLLLGSLAQYT